MDKHQSLLRELAHELRDSLSPIRSELDVMRLRGFDAKVGHTMAQRIERALESALSTLDAFVIAEQYANGTASLMPVALPLQQVLQLTQADLTSALSARCAFAAADCAVQVLADPTRSAQALSAMLEHGAALAAAQAQIDVRTGADARSARVHVRFALEPGSVPEQRWFESYRAYGSSRTALRTARRILQLQQGELVVNSGTAGYCELVASFVRTQQASAPPGSASHAASSEDSHAPRRTAETRARRIIIVDDNAEVRRAYNEGLTALGYIVTESADAEGALRAVSEALPDVALIDIHLPGMNGYQLARALKMRAGSLRLVMLSGMTLDEVVRRESRVAGFDQYFDKTAGPRALHALLLELP